MQFHMHSKLYDLAAVAASWGLAYASFHAIEGILKLLILAATLVFIVLGCVMRHKRIRKAEIREEEED